MKRCIIQYIVGARPAGVDEEDLDWRPIQGESFPVAAEARAWSVAESYDSDFDHRFTHRVVIVDVEPEPIKPPVKAPSVPPPAPAKPAPKRAKLEGTPKPAASGVNRQLTEFRAQQRFEKNLARLRVAIEEQAALDHIELLLECLDGDADACGSTLLAVRYREQFAALRALIDGKPALRVVK